LDIQCNKFGTQTVTIHADDVYFTFTLSFTTGEYLLSLSVPINIQQFFLIYFVERSQVIIHVDVFK